MPRYKPVKQRIMVVACCVVHNFIHRYSQNDAMFREFEVVDMDVDGEGSSNGEETSRSRRNSIAINLSDERAVEMVHCVMQFPIGCGLNILTVFSLNNNVYFN
ncbi:hypothetical protein CFOL_v3_35526 [Cephalotus follicularis]|uniref:DDE_4 domain-containing protein n=1 Tax=Cephalotus follicularis TaxID=3775 RepID=A0A1Q3DIB5_CEPFO|nr:hypothetical protein CFOL_v3_35526 [Cephalotus follicularis]